jgi:hypothetical protein
MKPELFQQGAKNKANIQRGHQQKQVLFFVSSGLREATHHKSPEGKIKNQTFLQRRYSL